MKMKTNKFTLLFQNTILLMICLFILKLFSVMYYSSRGINYGYPFDAFGFDPFHRFTDYLLPWAASGLKNIYDLSDPFYSGMGPAPYGFLQYIVLRYIPFRDLFYTKYINFLFVYLTFLTLNYILLNSLSIKFNKKKVLFYLIFCILNYPLFFLLDRGNLDIYAGILITITILFIYKTNTSELKYNICVSISITALVCLKPTFGLLILALIFCFPFQYWFISGLIILFSYSVPVLFFGADITYLFSAAVGAKKLVDSSSVFCHNLLCGLRAADLSSHNVLKILTITASAFYLIYFLILSLTIKNRKLKLYNFMAITLMGTLLFNDPSPDYRLIIVIPFFFSLKYLMENIDFKKYQIVALIISSSLIFGFENIYIKGTYNYFTILRLVSTIIFFSVIVNGNIPKNNKKAST